MYITFNDISWNEYLFWQKNDKQKINKINSYYEKI
jgi:Txe/YoeB family toxin of Txe-Axe toxin-antitoxin module